MAVYQIARIQVRRGLANTGTGVPQLASGELAWAVDSQELYIGNGSVAEGAPAVGNTRILSQHDLSAEGNVLNLLQYSYRVQDPVITTGANNGGAVYRNIQSRLDDQVNLFDFGVVGDGVTDDTAAIQNAIFQLFLNSNNYTYGITPDAVKARYKLNIPPGEYLITGTIYIPSYTTLDGAGIDKSIFYYRPVDPADNSPVFQCVDDTSVPDNIAVLSATQYSDQPRNIELSNFTINMVYGNSTGILLNAVRNSRFENLNIIGNTYIQTFYSPDSYGLFFDVVSAVVTCQDNLFKNIKLQQLGTAVYSRKDILQNIFEDCLVSDAQNGFELGQGSNGLDIGQQYGPRQTDILNTRFYNRSLG